MSPSKEAILERLHAAGFQPHDTLEKPKLWRQERSVLSMGGVGRMNGQSTEDLDGKTV